MTVVHDIDRPDVNGVPARMKPIAEQAQALLAPLLPFLTIECDDNLCSSVIIRGAMSPRQEWPNGIFPNARHFTLRIGTADGSRWYDPACDRVSVELLTGWKVGKFRKYTASVAKVLAKVCQWVENAR